MNEKMKQNKMTIRYYTEDCTIALPSGSIIESEACKFGSIVASSCVVLHQRQRIGEHSTCSANTRDTLPVVGPCARSGR